MRTTQKNLHDTTNPKRKDTQELVDVVEELPTLTHEQARDRHASPQQQLFSDEAGADLHAQQYRPAALELPGFGERRPDCGVEIPHICEDCGQPIPIGRTCSQSRCPRCATQWTIDRAVPIVSRIQSAAKMKDGAQYKHHVAVSPPDDLLVDAENPEQKCIDMLQDFARAINFDGAIFYHPYRGKSEEEGLKAQHDDDRGKWKERLFNDRDWENDVREELDHSPHFHMVGTCEFFPGQDVTSGIYEETGWLFHRITQNGSSRSLSDMHAVARAVTYAISHMGIDTRGDQNRWVAGKVGSAYHAADTRHHDDARRIVNEVAPDTLGISSQAVECFEEFPEEDVEDDHDHLSSASEADGDLEDDVDDSSTSTTTKKVKCRGRPVDVDDAEFVEDEDWQQSAMYAEDAVETRRQWEEAGGWQEWQARSTGQTTLSPGDPPPA